MSGWFEARARLSVEGGVAVPKPGKVAHPDALDLVEAAQMETGAKILARGRTYARAGQVIDVQSEPGAFTARIQGSDPEPYSVRLDRVTISGSDRVAADCDCPYGCDYGWCKHAAALAYVAAFLIDNDEVVRARWNGEQAQEAAEVEPLSEDEVASLRAVPTSVDPVEMLERAEAVVPYPRR